MGTGDTLDQTKVGPGLQQGLRPVRMPFSAGTGFVVAQIDRAGRRSEITLDPRGAVVETRVPRRTVDGTTEYAVTRYEYDQVGNRTKAISPRGVATTDDADDFAQVTVFDQLNRVKEQIFPYDKDDARYNTPDKVINTYDAVGRSDGPQRHHIQLLRQRLAEVQHRHVGHQHQLRLRPAGQPDEPDGHQRGRIVQPHDVLELLPGRGPAHPLRRRRTRRQGGSAGGQQRQPERHGHRRVVERNAGTGLRRLRLCHARGGDRLEHLHLAAVCSAGGDI